MPRRLDACPRVTVFLPIFFAFSMWVIYQGFTQGGRIGLWKGWIISQLLLPVWLVKGIGSITLDLRTAGGTCGIFSLLATGHLPYYRFALTDLLMVMLFATHLISGFTAQEMSLMTIPELMRRWLLPYIVGRIFFSSQRDLDRLLPVFARILLFLSIYAALEAGLKFNPINKLLGKYYPILESGEGYRWGIKRAQGPLDHPIYFGMMLVMTYPWAVEAGRRALQKTGPRWWLALPVLTIGAVICTASRGPIIACFFCVAVTMFFRIPKLRVPMIIGALVLGLSADMLKDKAMHLLSKAAGETEESIRYVYIDGEEYEYTGTAHRMLLFKVYRKAIQQSGWWGFGARLRGVPIDPDLADRFSSIDNHYLLFYLQRGKVGVGIFVAMTLLTLYYTARRAFQLEERRSAVCGAMCGGMLGVSGLLMSVWFAPDHGTVWLFTVGLSTCLYTLPPDRPDDSTKEAAHDSASTSAEESPTTRALHQPRPRRRLTAGHAPLR